MSAAARAGPKGHCRLVAVADLHGDLAQTQRVLQDVAQLVDEHGAWRGGCATLVQLGDLVDRHHQSLLVLDYFARLARQAAEDGGAVVRLLGNHCLMNLAGDTHYVNPVELEERGGEAAWRNLFSPFGKYGSALRRQPVAYLHNASGTVFVHGGLAPNWAALGVASLNRMAAVQLRAPGVERLRDGVFGPSGPVWDRTLIEDAVQRRDCTRLRRSLELLGARRMVVGHTPQASGKVGFFCKGQLVAADVGISGSMMGNLAAVDINPDTEEVVALYGAPAAGAADAV